MSKIEQRRTSARDLVEALQRVIALLREQGDMNISKILDEAAAAMNVADRKMMDNDDIGAAIAAIVWHQCRMNLHADADLQPSHEACRAFGAAFAHALDSRPENFSPGSRQWLLLRQTILVMLNDRPLSVSQLAQRAGVDRSQVVRDIHAGRLDAEKVGNQYVIEIEAAAAWLADPARGSRSRGSAADPTE